MSTAVEAPKELQAQTSDVVLWAKGLVVTSQDTYNAAVERLKGIKALTKEATEFFRPMKQQADAAKKAILDAEKSVLGPLEQAEGLAKRVLLSFTQEQERKRQQEQAKLQAEADEKARKERERLEKEAARLKTPEKREERLEMAAAVEAPQVYVAPTVERVQGTATRKIWKARVVNAALVPATFLQVNEKALDSYAKSTKGQIPVPGVEFYAEESLAIGGR